MERQYTVSASDFKTHCLAYLEHTRSEKTEYIVTKRGKPVAKLMPIREKNEPFFFGRMRGTGKIIGDIMSPLDEDWESDSED